MDSNKLTKMFIDYHKHLESPFTKYTLGDKLIGIGCKNKSMIVIWCGGSNLVPQLFEDNHIDGLIQTMDVVKINVCKIYDIEDDLKKEIINF